MSRNPLLTGLLILLPILASTWNVRAQDVADISLYRSTVYRQTTDGEPQPITPSEVESPFSALAVMEMTGAFLSDPDNLEFVRATTLQPPTGSLRALSFFDVFGGFVGYETFTSGAALESAFRAGNYRYTFSSFITGDEKHDLGVPDGSLLPVRRILDFAATQKVDPALPFVVRWNPLTAAPQFSDLEIRDPDTGDTVYDSGYLDGPVASIEIPAGILQPGRTYAAGLTITRVDTEDTANVPNRYASTAVTTEFDLKTISGGGDPLAITTIAVDPNGSVRLVITCKAGVPLEVQRATGLGSEWQTISTTVPVASPATVILPAGSVGNPAFLRAAQ